MTIGVRGVLFLGILGCAGAAPPLSGEFQPAAQDRIIPAGSRLELLWAEGEFTEGPALAPDGSIYFSDIGNRILRFDPKTGQTRVYRPESGRANGLKFDAQGRLIACEGSDLGGRCVSRWDVKTGKRTVLADKYKGKRFNAPNDVCIDLKGRIYFTDPRYLGDEKRELEHRAVYRIDAGGEVEEVTHQCEKPNGIALSPDMKTLYVVDHNNGTDKIDPTAKPPKKGAMKLYAFPLDGDGKVAGPRRTVIDFGKEDGIDGMTTDVKGNLYMAVRSLKRPGVLITNPEGKEIGFVPTGKPNQEEGKPGVGLPSNCDFGIGAESKVLYVTVDTSLYRIPLKIDGYHIPWAKK